MNQQKTIEALLELGFKQMYSSFPEKLNYNGYEIKVRENDTLAEILKKVFKAGQTIKIWEIKNVLQIT